MAMSDARPQAAMGVASHRPGLSPLFEPGRCSGLGVAPSFTGAASTAPARSFARAVTDSSGFRNAASAPGWCFGGVEADKAATRDEERGWRFPPSRHPRQPGERL